MIVLWSSINGACGHHFIQVEASWAVRFLNQIIVAER